MYLIEKTYLNIIKHDVVCFLKVIFVEQIVCLLTRKKGVDGDASTDLKKGPDVSGGSAGGRRRWTKFLYVFPYFSSNVIIFCLKL